MIITIDGPAASGKSSVAQELCKHLQMLHLKTGLLYRAVAYILINEFNKIISKDEPLELTDNDLEFVKNIRYEFKENKPQILYKNNEITEQLSYTALDQIASIVSANAKVRQVLLEAQRQIGKKYNIIADGRDCGSVIFPDANYKFYLTASSTARANRVFADSTRKTGLKNLEEIKNDIELRDKRDQERDVAPLTTPENAITIDNTDLNFEQTIQEFLKYIKI